MLAIHWAAVKLPVPPLEVKGAEDSWELILSFKFSQWANVLLQTLCSWSVQVQLVIWPQERQA